MTARRRAGWLGLLGILLAYQAGCARPDPKAFLLNRLQSAAKLATVKFTFNKVIWGEKEKRLFLKLKNASFLALSKVEITAGIDLAKMKPSDVEISGRHVRLKVPPVEVVAYAFPFEKIEVDRNYTASRFLNPIRLEDFEELLRLADADVRRSLAFLGIEKRTLDNTRTVLVRILKKFGFDTVEVDFTPAVSLGFAAYE
jgi:hypothetical protein